MAAMILAGLDERRREMAILRAMGAGPRTIMGLLMGEAALMALAGAVLGVVLLYLGLLAFRPWLDAAYGLYVPVDPPGAREGLMLLAVIAAAAIVSVLPALRAYRMSVADGMMVRR
jgi:putative ABC transport system permease protein